MYRAAVPVRQQWLNPVYWVVIFHNAWQNHKCGGSVREFAGSRQVHLHFPVQYWVVQEGSHKTIAPCQHQRKPSSQRNAATCCGQGKCRWHLVDHMANGKRRLRTHICGDIAH